MIKTIQPKELKEKLDKNEVILIDVREPVEYTEEYIEGATKFVPLGNLSLTDIPYPQLKPVVFYCRSGKRSESACRTLIMQNPNLDLINLEGGILAWKNEGYKVKH